MAAFCVVASKPNKLFAYLFTEAVDPSKLLDNPAIKLKFGFNIVARFCESKSF